MKETIERDREHIRNRKIEKMKFSYCDFLVANKLNEHRNYTGISTFDLLVGLEDALNTGSRIIGKNAVEDIENWNNKEESNINNSENSQINRLGHNHSNFIKHATSTPANGIVLEDLKVLKRILMKRENLFEAVIKFLDNKNVKDDCFYWAPGFEISNIFTFITEIMPNFITLYKEYYIRNVICNRHCYNALSFIEKRYPDSYEQFRLMLDDLQRFEKCITNGVWTNKEYNGFVDENEKEVQLSKECLDFLKVIDLYEINEDLAASLSPEASFVEVSVCGKSFTASLLEFDGLISKDIKFKNWWITNGLTEADWNCL